MNHSYFMLAPHYARLWIALIPTPARMAELTKICAILRAHQAIYEEASAAVWGKPDYWWYVAITDQMEGGGGAKTYLGNGQRLDRVTTEVPAGRGPFGSFVEGCVDALRGVPAPTSISQAAYNWEGFNGWGYLSKPIEDPYLASWSNQYAKGKYVADHQYDPEAVSGQPGALTILKVLGVPMGPHDPLPPQKPATPAPSNEPPMKGHVMVDVTSIAKTAEQVVEAVAKVEPTIATMASMFVPGAAPVVALVQPHVVLAIPYVERALNDIAAGNGGDLMNALIEWLQHNTKGQPNSPTLSPTA